MCCFYRKLDGSWNLAVTGRQWHGDKGKFRNANSSGVCPWDCCVFSPVTVPVVLFWSSSGCHPPCPLLSLLQGSSQQLSSHPHFGQYSWIIRSESCAFLLSWGNSPIGKGMNCLFMNNELTTVFQTLLMCPGMEAEGNVVVGVRVWTAAFQEIWEGRSTTLKLIPWFENMLPSALGHYLSLGSAEAPHFTPCTAIPRCFTSPTQKIKNEHDLTDKF